MSVVIKKEKCTGCETCLASCPFDAIEIKEEMAFINEYCNECKACLEVCQEGAIKEIQRTGTVTSHALHVTDYKGVWVFAEQRKGKIASVSFELLGVGRKLTD
ncbi:MAG: 4Fe-4S binding protein [Candidatus Mariimomonas ferrooxydans]